MRMQRLGGVGEVQARDGGDLQAAGLDAAVAAIAGVVGDGNVRPWQGLELVVQRGLIVLHDQQVGGVLGGGQPVGVRALGVERVGGDHGVGQVQAVQQRPELGDLVGRVVHPGLGEDAVAGVVHHGEQVDLRVAVVAAAAQGLARRWRPSGAAGGVPVAAEVPVRMAAGRPAKRRWRDRERRGRRGPTRGARSPRRVAARCRSGVAAGPERGQVLAGRVAGPLADRAQGSGAGQHRADRDGEHADQLPSATPVAGVGDLGEGAEQVTALVGGQRSGRSQPLGNRKNGR
jgi:hypothetical protein